MDAALVADVNSSSPDLNHPILFLWRYLETKVYVSTVDTSERRQRQIQQSASEMNAPEIFEHL